MSFQFQFPCKLVKVDTVESFSRSRKCWKKGKGTRATIVGSSDSSSTSTAGILGITESESDHNVKLRSCKAIIPYHNSTSSSSRLGSSNSNTSSCSEDIDVEQENQHHHHQQGDHQDSSSSSPINHHHHNSSIKLEPKLTDFFQVMSSTIKGLVSKNKIRYKEDGFDLDLTYICDNLIAMGFPGEKIEAIYRNNIEDVRKFLEKKHHGRYRIYNLCCGEERSYDPEKFQGSVKHFPFKDHNPPSLSLIPEFCTDVQDWLSQDKDNVAAVHCKAGKGRTGLMICCYLLHIGKWETAKEALNFYAQKRTVDKKGVTIPSQQRYVLYYEHLLKNPGIKYIIRPIILREVMFEGNLNTNSSVSVWINITIGDSAFCSGSLGIEWKKSTQLKVVLEEPLMLRGDVKVDIKIKNLMKRDKLCHFWFNTFFIDKDHNGMRNHQECSTTCTKTCVKFILRDPETVHSSSDNVRDLDRTMSCPPPADTQRSRLPVEWTKPEMFSKSTPPSNPTLFLSFSKPHLDISNKKLFTNETDFTITMGFTSDESVASPRCYRSNSDSVAQQSQQSRYSSSSSSSNSSTDEDISSESSLDSGGATVGRNTTTGKHYMI